MATYTNLGTQIKSIIQANVDKTNVVYDYVETNPSGYPAIMVEAFDGNGEFADTTRNKRSHIFRIIVQQERTVVGASEAERIMRSLVDQLISIFDSPDNKTLNNACIYALPIPSKWGYIQAPDIDVRSAEIILEAIDVI